MGHFGPPQTTEFRHWLHGQPHHDRLTAVNRWGRGPGRPVRYPDYCKYKIQKVCIVFTPIGRWLIGNSITRSRVLQAPILGDKPTIRGNSHIEMVHHARPIAMPQNRRTDQSSIPGWFPVHYRICLINKPENSHRMSRCLQLLYSGLSHIWPGTWRYFHLNVSSTEGRDEATTWFGSKLDQPVSFALFRTEKMVLDRICLP